MDRTTARRALSSYLEAPAVGLVDRLGLSPNGVTLLGLLVAGGSAYLLSVGYLLAGGLVLLASGALDLLDGALARATDRVSPSGALLDSVVDRISEAVVLLGLLVFYMRDSTIEGTVLVYLALVGSLMVSYMRARAEGLGIECKTGVMTRPERVIVLVIGLVVAEWWPVAVLVVLATIALLTFLTSGQRLLHTWREFGR